MGNQLPCCQEKDDHPQVHNTHPHAHASRDKSIVPTKTHHPPPPNAPYDTRSYIETKKE